MEIDWRFWGIIIFAGAWVLFLYLMLIANIGGDSDV